MATRSLILLDGAHNTGEKSRDRMARWQTCLYGIGHNRAGAEIRFLCARPPWQPKSGRRSFYPEAGRLGRKPIGCQKLTVSSQIYMSPDGNS